MVVGESLCRNGITFCGAQLVLLGGQACGLVKGGKIIFSCHRILHRREADLSDTWNGQSTMNPIELEVIGYIAKAQEIAE